MSETRFESVGIVRGNGPWQVIDPGDHRVVFGPVWSLGAISKWARDNRVQLVTEETDIKRKE